MEHQEVKVTFYLKKSEATAGGLCPVMGRIEVGRDSAASFSAKMQAPVSQWDSGRATGKSAAARRINARLDEIRASALAIYRAQSAIRTSVTAETVKCLLLGMASEQTTLLEYFRAFNDRFDRRVGVDRAASTAMNYRYACACLEAFLQAEYKLSDLPFAALDRAFIDRFDLYLRTERRLAPRTVMLIVTRLRTIVGHAISEGILTAGPFAGYEPERPRQEQKYLTTGELDRLTAVPPGNTKYELVRDLFLFSCWTGIPFGDMCRLSRGDLEVADDGEVWISTSRTKTKIGYRVPLLDVPLRILDRYRDIAPEGKLLPMYSNSELNRTLKRIATICGIERRLTFHMARHTYATEIALSHGVPLETVSRTMGHTSIATTQIYAKVTDDKIDADTHDLDCKIAERFSVAI